MHTHAHSLRISVRIPVHEYVCDQYDSSFSRVCECRGRVWTSESRGEIRLSRRQEAQIVRPGCIRWTWLLQQCWAWLGLERSVPGTARLQCVDFNIFRHILNMFKHPTRHCKMAHSIEFRCPSSWLWLPWKPVCSSSCLICSCKTFFCRGYRWDLIHQIWDAMRTFAFL